MNRDTKIGLGLLLGGAGAYAASFGVLDTRARGALSVGGLAAMGAGLYFLIFRSAAGGDAEGGRPGGLAGTLEGMLIGNVPDEETTPAPTINYPPPPGTPTLENPIPFTGRLVAPPPDGTVSRLPFRQLYEVLLEVTNNTHVAVTGALEIATEETGTYGGEDAFSRVLEGITIPAGGTIHKVLVLDTSAGIFSSSQVLAHFRFAGHHVLSASYFVE